MSIDWPHFVLWAVSAFALAGLICDVCWGRLFNGLTVPFAVFGVIVSIGMSGWSGLASSSLGLVAGLCVFAPLFLFGIMGGGDVKFLAAVGAWVGWKTTLEVALLSVLLGGLMALIILVAKGRIVDFWRRVRFSLFTMIASELKFEFPKLDQKLTMPYGIPMAVAAVWTVWAHPFHQWGVGLW